MSPVFDIPLPSPSLKKTRETVEKLPIGEYWSPEPHVQGRSPGEWQLIRSGPFKDKWAGSDGRGMVPFAFLMRRKREERASWVASQQFFSSGSCDCRWKKFIPLSIYRYLIMSALDINNGREA